MKPGTDDDGGSQQERNVIKHPQCMIKNLPWICVQSYCYALNSTSEIITPKHIPEGIYTVGCLVLKFIDWGHWGRDLQ